MTNREYTDAELLQGLATYFATDRNGLKALASPYIRQWEDVLRQDPPNVIRSVN